MGGGGAAEGLSAESAPEIATRTSTDFISTVDGVAIPGLPAAPGTDVTDIVTAGNRSGDAAINRNNIDAVLSAAGCTFADIVKATIFLADLSDFAKVNELYAARFSPDHAALPARSTVQVARLPRDSRVEIEVIAAKKH
jgi:2-iminobutanoate/2-iminopropanoate deaminase